MGGGAGKNKSKLDQQPFKPLPVQEENRESPLPVLEENSESPLPPQSPKLPAVPPSRRFSTHSRAPSIHNRSPSVHTRTPSAHSQSRGVYVLGSSNYENINQPNGTGSHTSLRVRDKNTPQNNYDAPVSLVVVNPTHGSKSRSSSSTSSSSSSSTTPLPPIQPARKASVSSSLSTTPLPTIAPPRKASVSTLHSHKHSHGTSSMSMHGKLGCCDHCPHCQRMKKRRTITTSPKPKWITENPGNGIVHIIMDEYDIEAVKKKTLSENGHLPGSYSYRPQLTIEQFDNFDLKKESYYTQTLIANTSPRVSATSTPFPDYDLLQRREQRLNKPYSLPLFLE